MPSVDELTDRLRDSRFGREVIGPKVARPVTTWLQSTFPDSAPLEQASEAPTIDEAAEDLAEQSEAEQDLPGGDQEAMVEKPTGFLGVAKAVKDRLAEHNLVVVAAGIAFWGLLAIPAILFATVSIAGLVVDPATVRDEVKNNLDGLPDEAKKIIGDQLASVSGGSTGGLITGLVVSLLLALWTSSGAMAKLMVTLNTIYEVKETRKFARLRGTALVLTFGGIVFVVAAVAILAVVPAILREFGDVGEQAASLVTYLRFPALGLVMVIGLGVLYQIGPNRSGGYRPVTIGAIVATVLWVALSALFTIYTATFASYNETYSSLGGIVILLLWLFITAFMVLIGAEIHALTGRVVSPGAAATAESD